MPLCASSGCFVSECSRLNRMSVGFGVAAGFLYLPASELSFLFWLIVEQEVDNLWIGDDVVIHLGNSGFFRTPFEDVRKDLNVQAFVAVRMIEGLLVGRQE